MGSVPRTITPTTIIPRIVQRQVVKAFGFVAVTSEILENAIPQEEL
jgi:hypothetical protein